MGEVKTADGNVTLRLQVCICTIGQDGIDRVAAKEYPRVDGVEHLVLLQDPENNIRIPEKLTSRRDFRIIRTLTRGLAINRNLALENATAPVALITDDDVTYIASDYLSVIEAFDKRPDTVAVSFRYRSRDYPKNYPDYEFAWTDCPKGYHLTAFELAVRPKELLAHMRYNEHFGFNTDFFGGEDDIFFEQARKLRLNCRFVPVDVGRHDHATTCVRSLENILRIEAKGAIVSYVSPALWPLRLLTHLAREAGPGKPFTRPEYLRAWLRGIKKARRLRVFGQ